MLPGEKKYPHIFSPIQIGKFWSKNRIKYASTETNYNYSDGFITEKEINYSKPMLMAAQESLQHKVLIQIPKERDKDMLG